MGASSLLSAAQSELADLDDADRLGLLVELSRELPPLGENRGLAPYPSSCRVQECQTAVHLWVDVADGRVQIEAHVPESSPTVAGLVWLIVSAIQHAPVAEVLALPDDVLEPLGLAKALGMQRQQGVRGMIGHIKREIMRRGNFDAASS